MSRRDAPAHELRAVTLDAGRNAGPAGLRELLAAPAILELPTVCDALGARTAAVAGFPAVTLPGFAIGAHLPGPTLLSVTDIERAVHRVAVAAGVPVLLDADAGWGTDDALPATIGGLAAAGAAGVVLNSQHVPDAVPFRDPVEHRKAQDSLVRRVRLAVGEQSDVVIAARCTVGPAGYPAALDTAGALLAAGADAVVVAASDEADARRFPRDLPGAWLIHAAAPALPGLPAGYPPDRLAAWGYAAVANKYHRCYCARTAVAPADVASASHVAGRG